MGKFKDVVAHLRQQIGLDRKIIEDRKQGTTRDFEMHVGERVDVTKASIDAAEARIARNERLAQVYEKKDAEAR
jgi:hypothetical protein